MKNLWVQPWQSSLPGKKLISLLILATTTIAPISSCARASISDSATESKTKIKIVTSTLPVTNFTKAVVGDRAIVQYLLPPNVGPHDYQARPEDVRTLAEADVLVKNGLGLDQYLDGLVENANNADLNIINTSEGVKTIANEEGVEHEGKSEVAGHEGEFNPHIWLDPKRAIEQVENIREGMITTDPAGGEIYVANAAAYINQLKALDQEIAAALAPYANKEFVTYHDFAPYFAQRYALKAEFLVGVPDEDPSPGDVRRVLNSAKASDLKTLLTEPQASGNPFEAVAKDLNVQVSDFDPMETGTSESVEADYYLKVMRQNLKNLQTALGSTKN